MVERITIAIACYNASATIERALASAQAQRWPETEIIVVDDASEDDSPHRVQTIVERDRRVRLLRHRTNRGPGATRQTLLDSATGRFIAFFDDDDESDPDRLSTQYTRQRDYAKATGVGQVLCYASGLRIYPNGYQVELHAIGSHPIVPSGEAVADYLLFNRRVDGLFYGGGTPTCALFAEVNTLRAAGGFDPDQRRVEDAELAVRLARQGAHFVGCPERLFRQYATQAGDKSPDMNHAAELRLIEKNRDYLEARDRYAYARRWCQIRYRHFTGDRRGFALLLAGTAVRYPSTTVRHLLRSGWQRWRHERRMAASPSKRVGMPSVLFVVSEDWYFWSHRRPMAEAAQKSGLRVLIATRVAQHRARIEAEGFEVIPTQFDRGSLNPLAELGVVWSLWRTIRRTGPEVVLAVGMKPILDAEVACLLAGRVPLIRVFAGMGAILGAGPSLLKSLITSAMRILAKLSHSHAVVQNADDHQELLQLGLARAERTTLIPGSGVDVDTFTPTPEPTGPVVAVAVARLLEDKGISELVVAARRLRERRVPLRIKIVGDSDSANPRAIAPESISAWERCGDVEFLGRRDDIAEILRGAHIAVLPSYREGLPMSLLEAAACGRPIVTTDVPGCRDLVPEGRTGILVPPRDPEALAEALATLVHDPAKRQSMGRAARALVEREFSRAHVVGATQALLGRFDRASPADES